MVSTQNGIIFVGNFSSFCFLPKDRLSIGLIVIEVTDYTSTTSMPTHT